MHGVAGIHTSTHTRAGLLINSEFHPIGFHVEFAGCTKTWWPRPFGRARQLHYICCKSVVWKFCFRYESGWVLYKYVLTGKCLCNHGLSYFFTFLGSQTFRMTMYLESFRCCDMMCTVNLAFAHVHLQPRTHYVLCQPTQVSNNFHPTHASGRSWWLTVLSGADLCLMLCRPEGLSNLKTGWQLFQNASPKI